MQRALLATMGAQAGQASKRHTSSHFLFDDRESQSEADLARQRHQAGSDSVPDDVWKHDKYQQ
jgi:hypothetical protein